VNSFTEEEPVKPLFLRVKKLNKVENNLLQLRNPPKIFGKDTRLYQQIILSFRKIKKQANPDLETEY